MHPCLGVGQVLRLLACELVAVGARGTTVALATCCKSFEDPVLDALWETQGRLTPLLKCLPQDVWGKGSFESFKRIPTKAEWASFCKYARRMRTLAVNTSEDPVASDILFALQLRTANEPLLPRLKTFECKNVTEAFIPFIPLFLSRKTVWVEVGFAKGSPTVMAASMIARLSALCPDLERIVLNDLTRSPVITEAVSEMVLTCNRSALRWFHVDSPLTEEAQRVVYQLPKLSGLWTVIQGHTLIPTVALPNLTSIDLEYDDHLDWLQRFRGSAFERLKTVYFRSESDQIGDFLGEFESVALTSISATLSTFEFHTSRSWNPNYRSLLPFTQLKVLTIEFSCGDKCSSRVTDNTIVDLVQAMPKLKILKLGNAPCGASTGVTINGLITLARGCRYLSDLRIHFRTASFVQTIAALESQPLSNDKTSPRRQDCALTNLEVGRTPLPKGFKLAVTLTLLQIFPRLLNIGFGNKRWRKVEEDIKLFKRIGTFVHHTGDALNSGDPPEDGRG